MLLSFKKRKGKTVTDRKGGGGGRAEAVRM